MEFGMNWCLFCCKTKVDSVFIHPTAQFHKSSSPPTMDGVYSSGHRSRELLDLIDDDWQCESLEEEEFEPSQEFFDSTMRHHHDGMMDDDLIDHGGDRGGATHNNLLTDRDGAVWSLSINPNQRHQHSSTFNHSHSSLSSLLLSGGMNGTRDTQTSHTFLPSSYALGANASISAVESGDGMRWTDRGIGMSR